MHSDHPALAFPSTDIFYVSNAPVTMQSVAMTTVPVCLSRTVSVRGKSTFVGAQMPRARTASSCRVVPKAQKTVRAALAADDEDSLKEAGIAALRAATGVLMVHNGAKAHNPFLLDVLLSLVRCLDCLSTACSRAIGADCIHLNFFHMFERSLTLCYDMGTGLDKLVDPAGFAKFVVEPYLGACLRT